MSSTLEELRQRAAALDREIAQEEKALDLRRRELAVLRRSIAELEELGAGLTSTRVDSTIIDTSMEAPKRTNESKFSVGSKNLGDAREKTLFGRYLLRKKMTASVWADEHRDRRTKKPLWSPQAVRAWMLDPKESIGARAIPQDAADLIAKETDGAVPATDASWPSGIAKPRAKAS